jgi:hypothetical protein
MIVELVTTACREEQLVPSTSLVAIAVLAELVEDRHGAQEAVVNVMAEEMDDSLALDLPVEWPAAASEPAVVVVWCCSPRTAAAARSEQSERRS